MRTNKMLHDGRMYARKRSYLDNIFPSRRLQANDCRAVIERLWRSLKQEAVYLHEINDGFQAKRIIDNWIGFYNPVS